MHPLYFCLTILRCTLILNQIVIEHLFPASMASGSFIGGLAGDHDFGPASSTRDFDSTLTFEESILTILPSAVFITAGFLRKLQLYRRASRTLPHYGHTLKTVEFFSYLVDYL